MFRKFIIRHLVILIAELKVIMALGVSVFITFKYF